MESPAEFVHLHGHREAPGITNMSLYHSNTSCFELQRSKAPWESRVWANSCCSSEADSDTSWTLAAAAMLRSAQTGRIGRAPSTHRFTSAGLAIGRRGAEAPSLLGTWSLLESNMLKCSGAVTQSALMIIDYVFVRFSTLQRKAGGRFAPLNSAMFFIVQSAVRALAERALHGGERLRSACRAIASRARKCAYNILRSYED